MTTDQEESAARAEVIARGCSSPVRVKPGVYVRCGSRVKSKCASCAELYRRDWAMIARSGVFDGSVERFRFYLLTLTAPSFGRVHRVPRAEHSKTSRCGCGIVHTIADALFRGVPLDADRYDYAGQVRWNRDAGVLWDRTRKRLRDRWDSLEYFIVREWQDRGVLHVHVLVRIARQEAPAPEVLRDTAREATAVAFDGSVVEWGAQAKCDAFRADGDGGKTIAYLSKALNYVLKDVATAESADDAPVEVWAHQKRLRAAALSMRCGRECDPETCEKRIHEQFGSRSHVVSASRRTKNRSGWSFSGLTRTVQRRLRREWWLRREAAEAETPGPVVPESLSECLAAGERRAMVARSAAVP